MATPYQRHLSLPSPAVLPPAHAPVMSASLVPASPPPPLPPSHTPVLSASRLPPSTPPVLPPSHAPAICVPPPALPPSHVPVVPDLDRPTCPAELQSMPPPHTAASEPPALPPSLPETYMATPHKVPSWEASLLVTKPDMPAYIPVPFQEEDLRGSVCKTLFTFESLLASPAPSLTSKREISPVVSTISPGSEVGSSVGFGCDDESPSSPETELSSGIDDDASVAPGLRAVNAGISLPPGLGLVSALPSPGSAAHIIGDCRPCAWFYKPSGCQNGANCGFCHICPENALKERKRQKRAFGRQATVKVDRVAMQTHMHSLNLATLL